MTEPSPIVIDERPLPVVVVHDLSKRHAVDLPAPEALVLLVPPGFGLAAGQQLRAWLRQRDDWRGLHIVVTESPREARRYTLPAVNPELAAMVERVAAECRELTAAAQAPRGTPAERRQAYMDELRSLGRRGRRSHRRDRRRGRG